VGSNPDHLLTVLSKALTQWPQGQRISVAYSGGSDSSVLLEAMLRLREMPDGDFPALRAVHVHHGLQPEADDWLEHCRSRCEERGVEFLGLKVSVPRPRSQSIEDFAREKRYQAFADCLLDGEVICTGQHANDQAETVLLQLLRGAGPRGLAAMPVIRPLRKGYLARPMLEIEKAVITDCVRAWNLEVIQDLMNFDQNFARVRVRQSLMDSMIQQFPGAVKTLNRSAKLQSAASEAIDTLAGLDFDQCQGQTFGTLSASKLATLDLPRCLETLRYWLRIHEIVVPNRDRLLEMSRQMTSSAEDRQPVVEWAGGEVRRYRDELYALRPCIEFDPNLNQTWNPTEELHLPWGRLWSEEVIGQGLKAQCSPLDVRLRQGGERCTLVSQRHSSSLKHLLQEHGVPPWQRKRLPLIHTSEGLAMIPGVGICEGYQAREGEPGRIIHWQQF
jgi:tRNA(Ile)-lysidine synthase